jgi:hypothetical protein
MLALHHDFRLIRVVQCHYIADSKILQDASAVNKAPDEV